MDGEVGAVLVRGLLRPSLPLLGRGILSRDRLAVFTVSPHRAGSHDPPSCKGVWKSEDELVEAKHASSPAAYPHKSEFHLVIKK